MSKLDKLNTFYREQLKDLTLVIDETDDGHERLSYSVGDTQKPVTIGGDRLVLPTKALLASGDYTNQVVFHPLSEQFNTSLSPVLNSLKSYVARVQTVAFMSSILGIATLISDPASHKNLSARAGEFIRDIGAIDEKLLASISSIIKKIAEAPERRLVNVLLKSSDDQTTLRTCIITYPITEAIIGAHESGTREVLGVKVRKDDLAVLRELFTRICGDKIVTTSSDKTAPFYEALLLAWQKSAAHYNTLHKIFKTKVEVISEMGPFELKWAETLDNFAEFADLHHLAVPTLPGNRPVVEEVEETMSKDKVFADKGTSQRETKQPLRRMSIEPRDDVRPSREQPVQTARQSSDMPHKIRQLGSASTQPRRDESRRFDGGDFNRNNKRW